MLALVTGATGFLGSHLAQRLAQAGHRVRALVRDSRKARIFDGTAVEIVAGDVTTPASLATAVLGVDVVFHSAALVSSWGPWPAFFETTVQGTENLLQAAAVARVSRFVHISTVRVYDDRYCRQHTTVTEEAPQGDQGFRAFGNYARAKVMAEAVVWRWRERLPISVIRPAWIYGPRDETIVPALMRFLRSSSARWPGRGNPCADPVYVTDVADCALAAALAPAAVGQAYNAAPPTRIGVREFLGGIASHLGIHLPSRTIPYLLAALAARLAEWRARLILRHIPPKVSRAGLAILTEDVRHDPAKAERELGWRARVELADGALRTAAWLRERYPELLR